MLRFKAFFKLTAITTLVGVVLAGVAFAQAKGSLQIKGSDTVLPLSQAWAEEFMKKNPNAAIAVAGGGSGVGLAGLLNGSCDVANSSREAKPKEISTARSRNMTLVAHRVAKDGIAIIVNPDNPVKKLTMAQIKAIYTGKIDNWKDLGGDNQKVIAVGRDSSSGTFVFFQDFVLGGQKYRPDMLSQPTNNAIMQIVKQSKGGIGYVGLAYAKRAAKEGTIHIVAVSRKAGEEAIPASDEAVASEKYPIFRYLYCYTAGKPTGLAKAFLDFVKGPEGQKIVEKIGYVAVK